MTLCEKCIHGEICADRGWMDEGDEKALKGCCAFKEIVLCKDCKGNPDIKTSTKGMVWCRKFRAEVHLNDFCSYGERR